MMTLKIVWRVDAGGDWYEQPWQGKTRKAALARWSRFWGLRQKDCAEFRAEVL